ncbi:S-adenosyl-L-methionine-dependent methyltransferase [Absidia repens]|uniref:S-adenosyl-L-methionine-dependent methyltransferase n=1 Tax=Absidia repens TaxID=90262 RepID=A0A1X2HYR8_9FUNG|nr:S-adenosyl-L-methionine-dependent methyltransferase [Absidia repens]
MLNSIRTFLQNAIKGNMATATEEKIVHRVKVQNLPIKETPQVKRFLNSHGILKYKKAPQWTYAYINFESEQAAKEAMTTLNGVSFKKRILSTEYTPISEEIFRQRFRPQPKRPEVSSLPNTTPPLSASDNKTFAEQLADQVTPLYKVPYEDQVAKKHKLGVRQIRNLRKKLLPLADLSEERKAQLAWIYENVEEPPCQVLDPIASPDIEGYRTKCEFSIGKDPSGKPTVGFLQGLYRDGLTSVLEPSASIHVPQISKQIAKTMEQYIQSSDYPVYDRVLKTGVWRSLMVKAQHTGDVMVLIQLRTSELSEDQLQKEKKKLVDYWCNNNNNSNDDDAGRKIKTLILQQWDGDSNGIRDQGKTEILAGDGYVYEQLLDHRFRISSKAFFQVNTKATEQMLRTCADWCTTNENMQPRKTTLLDLCCGAGSIGITMAHLMDRVVGIEMISEAIDDARFNAELNNITNAHYYAGKVEEKIHVVTNEQNENVVAVLDPPRSGVHNNVIRAVREASQIKKVVFISCDAKQAMQNFIGLCRPTSNRYQGIPFKPQRAVTIDLFPHTDHAELMIEFVRA